MIAFWALGLFSDEVKGNDCLTPVKWMAFPGESRMRGAVLCDQRISVLNRESSIVVQGPWTCLAHIVFHNLMNITNPCLTDSGLQKG